MWANAGRLGSNLNVNLPTFFPLTFYVLTKVIAIFFLYMQRVFPFTFEQLYPDSSIHIEEQPSPSIVFPSSHYRSILTLSPQI
jgi:hypothetical protein